MRLEPLEIDGQTHFAIRSPEGGVFGKHVEYLVILFDSNNDFALCKPFEYRRNENIEIKKLDFIAKFETFARANPDPPNLYSLLNFIKKEKLNFVDLNEGDYGLEKR